MAVKELSGETFDEFIRDENAVIDFWAEWCAPCRMLKPIFNEVSKEHNAIIKFGSVNVDDSSELAQNFGIMSIPALIFFKKGQEADRVIGAISKDELEEKIKELY